MLPVALMLVESFANVRYFLILERHKETQDANNNNRKRELDTTEEVDSSSNIIKKRKKEFTQIPTQMAVSTLTSASGILALLDEEQDEIKEFALHKLNELVDEFWAEIAATISKM